jgi:hypothetical protein
MLIARKLKVEEDKKIKDKETEEINIKKKQIHEKLTEKIINKAVKLDKKRISKAKVAKQILLDIESVSSEEEEEEEEEKPKRIIKPKAVKPRPIIKEIKESKNPLMVFF